MMGRGERVRVECMIEKGAFSGERVFRLFLADGKTEYSGVAPAHYCYDANQDPIRRDEPAAGQSIRGFVDGILIRNGGSEATVEFPDGQALRVNLSQVPYRQETEEETRYVPVRP